MDDYARVNKLLRIIFPCNADLRDEWLIAPNKGLSDKIPLDMIKAGRGKEVVDYLFWAMQS
jgi:uncharacterized protein (DUF2384 family)